MVTVSKELQQTLQGAVGEARRRKHEYVTLEHLLHAMTKDKVAAEVLLACGADLRLLERELEEYLDRTLESLGAPQDPEQTAAFQRVLQRAAWHVQGSGRTELNAGDVLVAITRERGSHAVYLLEKQGVRRLDILQYISHGVGKEGQGGDEEQGGEGGEGEEGGQRPVKDPFKTFTVNLVERASQGLIDPLVGRDAEIERTIQVLCRRRKNNPVFVGDPGVGKTAIVEGLALAIHEKKVPAVLAQARRSTPSTWAPCSPAPSSAASSSSGSRASSPASSARRTPSSSSTRSTPSWGPGPPPAAPGRLQPPRSPASPRASCAASAPPPSTTTSRPSSATTPWPAASRRSTCTSPRWRTRS